jgi:lambda family phage tail tape measure protein
MTLLPDRITERDAFPDDFDRTADRVRTSTNALGIGAAGFARAMSKAFSDATTGGKKFDDVLRQLALRLSDMTAAQALQPLARNLADGLGGAFGDLLGGVFGEGPGSRGRRERAPDVIGLMGRFAGLTPFAAGGVISTPAYFPLGPGGLGVAGEAGPEAILPLARGRDGRLGVATSGASAAANVTVHIATPDADSFRRSEAYISGQIARAVARGQRNL